MLLNLGFARQKTAGTSAYAKLLTISCYMNGGAVRAALGLSNPLKTGLVSAVGHRLLDLMVGSCGVCNRFSELKAVGIVSSRFTNSPITRGQEWNAGAHRISLS